MIYIINRRRKIESIRKDFHSAYILDVTSKSDERAGLVLSPFYPHGNIPIPLVSNGLKATCVEAVWQGLKVFESQGVDFDTFKNDTMKNLKRTVRKYGKPLGHQNGAYGTDLLDYFTARMRIYLPTYKWMLQNVQEVKESVELLKAKLQYMDIVLLDYNTNIDVRDISSPLSHAALIKAFIEDKYPSDDEY